MVALCFLSDFYVLLVFFVGFPYEGRDFIDDSFIRLMFLLAFVVVFLDLFMFSICFLEYFCDAFIGIGEVDFYELLFFHLFFYFVVFSSFLFYPVNELVFFPGVQDGGFLFVFHHLDICLDFFDSEREVFYDVSFLLSFCIDEFLCLLLVLVPFFFVFLHLCDEFFSFFFDFIHV